jgi:hypothetical protein
MLAESAKASKEGLVNAMRGTIIVADRFDSGTSTFQEEEMAAAATTFVWWLVVASPQGGMVVMPNSFDTRDACMAAVTEFQKNTGQANWVMQCVPTPDQNFEE